MPSMPASSPIRFHDLSKTTSTYLGVVNLEKVRAGARIYVSDAAGNELIYVVTRVAALDLRASTQVQVFGPAATRSWP